MGLNVSTELGWFARIVACGLEGKGTTSLERERDGVEPVPTIDEVGDVFVRELARGLQGVDGVERIEEEEEAVGGRGWAG